MTRDTNILIICFSLTGKVCPPSNFECVDLGTHGRGPQCVMQSQVCDGTTHCADGTDEYNCPDTGMNYTVCI